MYIEYLVPYVNISVVQDALKYFSFLNFLMILI